MPLPYRVLIELDMDFDTQPSQDVPLPRPGEIISAGFTEFNGYDPTRYIIIEEPRASHTKRTLRTQDQESFDYWNGTGIVTVTQSQEEIQTRRAKQRKDAREAEEGPPVVQDLSQYLRGGAVIGADGSVTDGDLRNNGLVRQFLIVSVDGKEYHIPAYAAGVI